jgi:hypothetical protein
MHVLNYGKRVVDESGPPSAIDDHANTVDTLATRGTAGHKNEQTLSKTPTPFSAVAKSKIAQLQQVRTHSSLSGVDTITFLRGTEGSIQVRANDQWIPHTQQFLLELTMALTNQRQLATPTSRAPFDQRAPTAS